MEINKNVVRLIAIQHQTITVISICNQCSRDATHGDVEILSNVERNTNNSPARYS